MKKTNNNAAANKVSAPATSNNGKANNVKANKATTPKAGKAGKAGKANKTTTPPPALGAAEIATTAAAWLAKYKSVRGIKDTAATLIAKHGKDNYNAVMQAVKDTRAAEIAKLHTESRAVLSYAAVLEREYKALAASKSWRKWCGLIAAKYSTAADFVAACYPSVLENGQPARPVNYTNGTTIYRAFRPLVYADTCGAGAVAILCKALDGFKKAHTRAANKAQDKADKGGALVLNKVYKDGQAVAAYNAVTESRTDKDGRQYVALVSAGKATISADMLAKINVTSAGKDGHRLPTLAEYNADLRK